MITSSADTLRQSKQTRPISFLWSDVIHRNVVKLGGKFFLGLFFSNETKNLANTLLNILPTC